MYILFSQGSTRFAKISLFATSTDSPKPKSALRLILGNDTIDVADAVRRVRVLGVLVTPDLCLDKHVTAVSVKCFFQLRQMRRVQRSLDRSTM